MLTTLNMMPERGALRARQRGVVLMMALIVLVAMTLAGIALVRSVDTSNVIAGNLAFQQAATNSGDAGTETAANWLQSNAGGVTLHSNIYAQGYAASFQPPPAIGQSWDAYWKAVLVPAGQVVTLTQDAAGNTVAYTIQRLCSQAGDPATTGSGCAVTQSSAASGTSSRTAGTVALLYSSQIYYRITTRIAGPRNTVSYIQTIVAL
jgi:Tfp pilus assembly protein PilX